MKKLFKKLRLWILEKLHATPNEVALFDASKVVTRTSIPFVVLSSSRYVPTELLNDYDYVEEVYKSLSNEISDLLRQYYIIETADSEIPGYKIVMAKTYVGVKGKDD